MGADSRASAVVPGGRRRSVRCLGTAPRTQSMAAVQPSPQVSRRSGVVGDEVIRQRRPCQRAGPGPGICRTKPHHPHALSARGPVGVIVMSRISRLVVLMTSVAPDHLRRRHRRDVVYGDWPSGGPSSMTGSYVAGSFAGFTYSGVTGTITYQGCLLAGQAVEWSCGHRLTAQFQPPRSTLVDDVLGGLGRRA